MTLTVERIAPRENTYQVPELAPNEQGWFRLTPPGGTIQPMQAAPGVRTVGKLEVMVHPEKDLPLVDGRTRDFYVVSTIPSQGDSKLIINSLLKAGLCGKLTLCEWATGEGGFDDSVIKVNLKHIQPIFL